MNDYRERVSDTYGYELIPKLRFLTLEGVDEDGDLIWSGHQDDYAKADHAYFYYCEHRRFPWEDERDEYDDNQD